MPDCYATVIGGGVVGTAIAYELSKQFEDVCLLERNRDFPGENQTARNSGVIHAGIYYDSPLKASLCVEGSRLMYDFCAEHNIPARQTGKLVVATTEEEDKSLDGLLLRSQENKVPGVRKIDGDETRELEPNVEAYSALWIPSSGIVDPTALVKKLKSLSELGEYFLLGTEVKDIVPLDGEFLIKVSAIGTGDYEFTTEYVINSAGLYSDEIARMVDPEFPLKIFPVRGEAAKFYQSRDNLRVSRNVYPAPVLFEKPDGSIYLSVGVHLTPTFAIGLDGDYKIEESEFSLGREVTVGPLNQKRGIGKEDFGSDLAETSAFLERIEKYFPGVRLDDLQLHQTGIQAILARGNDFHIAPDLKHQNMINLVGICSPGLTASLAIAKMVKSMVEK